jgi:hypothetical protein
MAPADTQSDPSGVASDAKDRQPGAVREDMRGFGRLSTRGCRHRWRHLEEHLGKLAGQRAISVVTPKGEPKKAAQINTELYGANAYGKPDHALMDAWLKLRNAAAHREANFEPDHSAEKVDLMLRGIRELIARLPRPE